MSKCSHVKRELGVALQPHWTNGRTCNPDHHKRGEGLSICKKSARLIQVMKCTSCGDSI